MRPRFSARLWNGCGRSLTSGSSWTPAARTTRSAIISEYGPVTELPFEDFVTTKNKALALATGEYILFMDADERLLAGAETLRAVAEAGEWDAVSGRIIDGPAPDQVVMQYDRLRLWRKPRVSGWRSAGRACTRS